ncbi:hypothetical protein HK105_201492 [Polyrhizophydium stewartii]|uniref:G-protein coupled receptors family 1 profile domain-containing protein n=1 Tax=Polyrhizophydium stewartii TaxID=2732419 RepID=A0ABR4NGJ5_9FUNG
MAPPQLAPPSLEYGVPFSGGLTTAIFGVAATASIFSTIVLAALLRLPRSPFNVYYVNILVADVLMAFVSLIASAGSLGQGKSIFASLTNMCYPFVVAVEGSQYITALSLIAIALVNWTAITQRVSNISNHHTDIGIAVIWGFTAAAVIATLLVYPVSHIPNQINCFIYSGQSWPASLAAAENITSTNATASPAPRTGVPIDISSRTTYNIGTAGNPLLVISITVLLSTPIIISIIYAHIYAYVASVRRNLEQAVQDSQVTLPDGHVESVMFEDDVVLPKQLSPAKHFEDTSAGRNRGSSASINSMPIGSPSALSAQAPNPLSLPVLVPPPPSPLSPLPSPQAQQQQERLRFVPPLTKAAIAPMLSEGMRNLAYRGIMTTMVFCLLIISTIAAKFWMVTKGYLPDSTWMLAGQLFYLATAISNPAIFMAYDRNVRQSVAILLGAAHESDTPTVARPRFERAPRRVGVEYPIEATSDIGSVQLVQLPCPVPPDHAASRRSLDATQT